MDGTVELTVAPDIRVAETIVARLHEAGITPFSKGEAAQRMRAGMGAVSVYVDVYDEIAARAVLDEVESGALDRHSRPPEAGRRSRPHRRRLTLRRRTSRAPATRRPRR